MPKFGSYVSAIPTPPPHRAETKKSEADESEARWVHRDELTQSV